MLQPAPVCFAQLTLRCRRAAALCHAHPQSYRNTTRLCLHEADPACVSAHSLQHCIDEKMRVLSSGGAGGTLNALAAQQPKQQQSDLSNGALAGLTIGVAIGALLLAALSMFVLQRHRARRVSREPCLAKWSQGSFDASSIDPWLLSKGGGTLDGGTSGTAGGLPSSADWGAAGGLGGTGAGHSAPPAALRSGAGGHVSTPDAAARAGQRGTRLAVAISSKVRRIHQARLLTAIAAGRHDGSAGSGMSAATSAGAMKRIASAPSLLSDDDGAGCVSSGSGSRRMQPGSNDGLQLKEVLGRGGFGVCYRCCALSRTCWWRGSKRPVWCGLWARKLTSRLSAAPALCCCAAVKGAVAWRHCGRQGDAPASWQLCSRQHQHAPPQRLGSNGSTGGGHQQHHRTPQYSQGERHTC